MALAASRIRPNDAELSAFIKTHLPIGTSYESLMALAQAISYIMYTNGGTQKSVEFVQAGEVLTNLAAAATLLRASIASAKLVDLTDFTEVRIVAATAGVAGPAGAKVAARFKTTLGADAAAYAAIGTSAVEALIDDTDLVVASAWIPLAAAAKAEVYVAIITSGGDGAIDPAVGSVEVQFR